MGRLGLTKSFAEQSNDLPSIRLVAEHRFSTCRAQGLVAEHGVLEPREKGLTGWRTGRPKASLGSLMMLDELDKGYWSAVRELEVRVFGRELGRWTVLGTTVVAEH